MMNLNDLVVNLPEDVRVASAFAINNKGEIAGYTNTSRSCRLVPVSDPPVPLLLLDD